MAPSLPIPSCCSPILTRKRKRGLSSQHGSSSTQDESSGSPSDAPLDRKYIFPLMDLPAELRIYIYRMCLKRDRPVLLHMPKPPPPENDEDKEGEGWQLEVPQGLRLPRDLRRRTRATFHVDLDEEPGAIPRPSRSKQEQPDDGMNHDSLVVNILRVSKRVHFEARPVLYADNRFSVRLDSALMTLSGLHQRSRSLIKVLIISITSHHDILEGFADLVRLGMRYCWGLELLHIKLTTAFPEDSGGVRGSSVYANAFHILRWLPKSCKVRLEGKVPEEVERIIRENERNAEILDEQAYQRRQHQMPEKRAPEPDNQTSARKLAN